MLVFQDMWAICTRSKQEMGVLKYLWLRNTLEVTSIWESWSTCVSGNVSYISWRANKKNWSEHKQPFPHWSWHGLYNIVESELASWESKDLTQPCGDHAWSYSVWGFWEQWSHSLCAIGRFSEAGLLEWMCFVIFRARSCERSQHTSGLISE